PVVVVPLDHRSLSSVAYPLKLFDELIIGLNRLFDRNIIRLFEANGLKQLAPNVFHAAGLTEINLAATEIVLLADEVEYLSFSHNCRHCCAIGFVVVCIAS